MVLPIFADHFDHLDRCTPSPVISWACPVPYFGDACAAAVATVGINPSNLEFMDNSGRELDGQARRLPTLRSLGLRSWAHADSRHLRQVVASCTSYFERRPYDRWFGVLERILRPAGCTYYGQDPSACHVDLVAFATRRKWSSLLGRERRHLLDSTSEGLALLVRSMSAQVFVLNGSSVVRAFEISARTTLEPVRNRSWDLPRRVGSVPGLAYMGSINELAGVPLGRTLTVVGFNHNMQSSFGVTSKVIEEVGEWLASVVGQHR